MNSLTLFFYCMHPLYAQDFFEKCGCTLDSSLKRFVLKVK